MIGEYQLKLEAETVKAESHDIIIFRILFVIPQSSRLLKATG